MAESNTSSEEKQNASLMILGKMMRELFRVLKKRGGLNCDIKLAMQEFGLLHAISKEADEVTQKDMAEAMGKDKSAILRVIDSLEEKKMVRRVADQNDRRKNCLMITKKGEAVLKQYMEMYMDLVKEVEEGLTKEEMDTFYKVANHMKSKAEKL